MKYWLSGILISICCIFAYGDAPKEIPLRFAENFRIKQFDGYKLLTVKNPYVGADELHYTYALVDKEANLPDLPAEAVVIRTPVSRMVTMATTFLGYVQALDRYEDLIGVASVEFTNDPIVLQRVKDGLIEPVKNGSAVDSESMLLMRPELILTSSTGSPQFDVHPTLVRSGLPVVVTAAYMENHPLGRAEWIKFVAAFFDQEQEADIIFNKVADEYERLRGLVEKTEKRPSVFTNAPYSGKWHVSGGLSYTAQVFKDAGATYIWDDIQSRGAVPMDFERVLIRAAHAEFWLNPSGNRSISQLLDADKRFSMFDAVSSGKVFNNTMLIGENGGNAIWERGVMHPEEILADLIHIFHPELDPDHRMKFYEQLF